MVNKETKIDGGPAFPFNPWKLCKDGKWRKSEKFNGMTLRDWFAGQALCGMLSARDEHGRDCLSHTTPEETAKWAYERADEMLKAKQESE
jgi:hypothetical protein